MRHAPEFLENVPFVEKASPRLHLLGPMRAEWDTGRSFLPRNSKTRAVLAVLALGGERPVSRNLLINLLWKSRGRVQAQASLRQSVHELRGYLAPLQGARLQSDGDRLKLHIVNVWIDAIFVQTPGFLVAHMADVFRGPLLGDLLGLSDTLDAWIMAERTKLSAITRLKVAAFLANSPGHAATVRMAEAVLSSDPSQEAAWGALAASYMEQGDSVAALDVYQRCLASNKTSDGSTLIDANRVLAHCFSGTISDESVAGSARPMQDFDSSLFPWRGTRNGSALVLPWRTAYLAMAPTRTVGDAPPEFAMCIDWELVAALSKFEDLSCSPVSADREIDVSLARLTAEGFDFLLEGCIGRIAGHDQLVMRLRALHVKGEVFWSQRVCRKVSAGGLLEADFASALAPQIACEISKHKAEIVENCEEAGTGAGRLILRASRSVGRLDRHNLADIERRLSEAIKGDSRRPALLAWSAYVQLLQLGQGWVSDIEATRRRMGELIDKFISLNPDNASVLPIAGHVLAFTQHRLEEGLSLHEKALSRNPNLPLAWLFSGLAHTYAGAHKEAISRIQRAKLLSPADSQAYFIENGLSLANLLNGDNAGALAASQNAIRLNPNFSSSFKVGVSASGYLAAGRDDSHLLKRLLVLEPRLTVERVLSRTPFTRRADQTHLAEGLRLAGLPG